VVLKVSSISGPLVVELLRMTVLKVASLHLHVEMSFTGKSRSPPLMYIAPHHVIVGWNKSVS